MPILKETYKEGSLKGFLPNLVDPIKSTQTADATLSQASDRDILINSNMLDEERIAIKYLKTLEKNKIKQLLEVHFKSDVLEFVEAEKSIVIDKFFTTLKLDNEKHLTEQQHELENITKQWSTLVNTMSKSTSIVIDNSPVIVQLVTDLLSKLIGYKVCDLDNMEVMINSLIEEYSSELPLNLSISPVNYQYFVSQNMENKISNKINVISDDNLLIGDYKLELQTGSVSHNISKVMKQIHEKLYLLSTMVEKC
jgi:flagellar biosynthesis/type III secretory pathway protein FliH